MSLKQKIERYLELKAKKSDLSRQVSVIEKELDPIEDELKAVVAEAGGSKRHSGFLMTLRDGQKNPSWKTHFIQAQGSEAAMKVIADTAPSQTLLVHAMNPKKDETLASL